MSGVFPAFSSTFMASAKPGSIVMIPRFEGAKLALVTDQVANNIRSFVLLNSNFQNRPSVIFAENWRDDAPVLEYKSEPRFELGTGEQELDPMGHRSWEIPGVIVSMGDDLFIRAAPYDSFDGPFKLVNIRDGSVYSDRLPNRLWTFLSWQLWVRDPLKERDLMLNEFRLTR